MKQFFSAVAILALCFSASAAFSQTKQFEFFSHNSNTYFHFPGLDLGGELTGSIRITRNIPSPYYPGNNHAEFSLSHLALSFQNAPPVNINAFQFNQDTNSYTAAVDDAWVFRKVKFEIKNIDPLLTRMEYRISVVTTEDYTGSSMPGPYLPDVILLEGMADLVDKTPFNLVDQVTVELDAKQLVLSLNGNLSSNFFPEHGPIGEGIQLKVLWFGRGEKLGFLPFQVPPNAEPIKIEIVSHNFGGSTEYDFSIGYKEKGTGYITQTPWQPLRPFIEDLYSNSYP